MRRDRKHAGLTLRSALSRCMLGLVLANVLFVQLTGAAGAAALALLLGATVAAPVLRRFRGRWWYGLAWNLAAFGALGLLISHAANGQLSRLLEDGLLLALLCQVHLLNNLRDEHRPDLLFINAFLIAIITGYITADLGFALAFFAFVPVFVAGLGFMALGAEPGAALAPGDGRRVVLDALRRSGVLAVATGLVFLVWPRDFQREALLTRYFELPQPRSSARVDFAEELRLERLEGRREVPRLALELEVLEAGPGVSPTLWRGAVLGELSRTGDWSEGTDGGAFLEAPWTVAPDGLSMTRPGTPAWTMHVTRHGGGTRRLFLPPGAVSVVLDAAHTAGRLEARREGGASYSNPGRLGYTVGIAAEAPGDGRAPAAAGTLERSLHTASAAGLARRLRSGVGPARSALGDVELFSTELQRRYAYRAPGEPGAADSLHDFLTTDAGGHCELFASALAVMARSAGIPARVATGYRVEPPSPEEPARVMSTAAHAWVEVLDDDTGRWVSFDPTPATAGGGAAASEGLVARLRAEVAGAWARVTGFDAEQRAALVAWLRGHAGLLITGACAALALLVLARRRRTPRRPESVRRLEASVVACGVSMDPGETPREVLERVRSLGGCATESVSALELAVAAHERDRYGPAR